MKMAGSTLKLFLCFAVVFLLFHVFAEASLDHGMEVQDDDKVVTADKMHHRRPKINCSFACARRCRKSSRKNVCHRACGTCCLRCHCVPAGTYGNKNSCPCYARLRTHGKRPKCP
ncbi:gibberellin-regulated protein 9 [Asparagus officinalis]|uniref:gibberellin-regulated protein 9 n=1 Tax=Asparagus officinalis TaxID=4686 RepID=UPI00098E0853|nr:gibberellin-regulated protein 9 [Asparagus officinalis]